MSLDKGLVQLGSFGDGLALAGTLGAAKVGERERERESDCHGSTQLLAEL